MRIPHTFVVTVDTSQLDVNNCTMITIGDVEEEASLLEDLEEEAPDLVAEVALVAEVLEVALAVAEALVYALKKN